MKSRHLRIERGFVNEVIYILRALLMSLKACSIHAFHCLQWVCSVQYKRTAHSFPWKTRRTKCRWEDAMEDVDQFHVAPELVVGFCDKTSRCHKITVLNCKPLKDFLPYGWPLCTKNSVLYSFSSESCKVCCLKLCLWPTKNDLRILQVI
jgi:hypothetical protein